MPAPQKLDDSRRQSAPPRWTLARPRFPVATALLLIAAGPLCAQQDAGAVFENSVQPLLKTNCLPCHNQRNRSSGLALDSRESMLAGGNRGAAIKPGAPAESLLIRAVEQQGDLKMPPKGRLNDE